MRFYSGLTGTIVGVAIALIQPEIGITSTGVDVSRKAQEMTVLIKGPKLGSGVLVWQKNDIYYVLTNWHVMDKAGTYIVQTFDNKEHTVNYSSVVRLPRVDLAVLQFTSSQKYRVAHIGNSEHAKPGLTVYIAGAPEPVRGIEQRTVLTPKGEIVGEHRQPQDGYTLIHNINTFPGMSGGPLVDENGRLIGIHGRGARDTDGQKVGFNLGIPINIFMESEIAKKLGLVVDKSPIVVQPKPHNAPPSGRPPKVSGSEGTDGAPPGRKY
ncbi:MAG: serine protease [Goleter apudmare HA4340-LM2]|jgi:S1-C subfamily serine protease|nr:serine protease [Goleter apudmare HA4340-LM2]